MYKWCGYLITYTVFLTSHWQASTASWCIPGWQSLDWTHNRDSLLIQRTPPNTLHKVALKTIHIFNLGMIIYRTLPNKQKVFCIHGLEKAYDTAEWEAIWEMLKISEGIWSGWKFNKTIESFLKMPVHVLQLNGKADESCRIHGGVRQGYMLLPWLLNLIMMGTR